MTAVATPPQPTIVTQPRWTDPQGARFLAVYFRPMVVVLTAALVLAFGDRAAPGYGAQLALLVAAGIYAGVIHGLEHVLGRRALQGGGAYVIGDGVLITLGLFVGGGLAGPMPLYCALSAGDIALRCARGAAFAAAAVYSVALMGVGLLAPSPGSDMTARWLESIARPWAVAFILGAAEEHRRRFKVAFSELLRLLHEKRELQATAEAASQRVLDLVNGLDAIVWEFQPAIGRFSYVRRRADVSEDQPLQAWQRQPADWIDQFIHPEDRALVHQRLRDASEQGESFELRGFNAQGEPRWYRSYVRAYDDPDTGVRYVSGVTVDITANKEIEETLRERDELYSMVVEQSPDGIGIFAGTVPVYVNQAALEIHGFRDLRDLVDHQLGDYIVPEDLARLHESGARRQRGEAAPPTNEYRVRLPDGTLRTVEATVSTVTYRGRLASLSIMRDATERRRQDEELCRWGRLFQHAQWGVSLKDAGASSYTFMNPAYAQMHGYTVEEMLKLAVLDIYAPESRDDLARNLAVVRATGHYVYETKHIRKDGSVFPVLVDLTLVRDEEGQEACIIANVQDITERKRLEAQLEHLAGHDPLTDLYNRRRFQEEVEREIALAKRYGTAGALLFLDLDGFKAINDQLGHTVGDQFLAGLAGVLREQLRRSDILGRIGGDEFAVLLPRCTDALAQSVAERILETVRHHRLECEGHSFGVSASIGIALFPEYGATCGDLLARADAAMYRAKELGGDHYLLNGQESPHLG